jgi:hypothetical protein
MVVLDPQAAIFPDAPILAAAHPARRSPVMPIPEPFWLRTLQWRES